MEKSVFVLISTVFFSLLLSAESSWARSLYWQELAVEATLSDDGRLHVREEQTMVFTGDWNGGERRFRVEPGQSFTFSGLFRKTDDGNLKKLQEGSLDKVDKWNWSSADTLRWRSRLPEEPVFSETKITYVLEYIYGRILIPQKDGEFLLDHDFAFPDRPGEIQNFRLTLHLGERWQYDKKLLSYQMNHLPQNQSFPVKLEIKNTDPGHVMVYEKSAAPAWMSWATSLLLVAALIFFSISFYLQEKKHTRFAKGPATDEIDEQWLVEHVFVLLPETVGAMWDKKTGGHEVAAILARLVVEKKLGSRLEQRKIPGLGWNIPGRYELHLELNQPREAFSGYERELIDGFFIDGDTTDIRRIRKYYQKHSETFSPVQQIREPLKKKVAELSTSAKEERNLGWFYMAFLALIALFIWYRQILINEQELPFTIGAGFFGIIGLLGGGKIGFHYRCRSDYLYARSLLVHLFPFWAVVLFIVLNFIGISTMLTFGLFMLYLGVIVISFHFARCRDSLEGVDLCRNLVAARRYFKKQLNRNNPTLKDEWFPYLLAFGLGPNIDAWTERFGRTAGYRTTSSTDPAISADSGSYGFSGGGGDFGGAGASGAWAKAATTLGESVSSPSGGSDSSSGGGGSSSGGGGGGGW